jgi:hypothetical protein
VNVVSRQVGFRLGLQIAAQAVQNRPATVFGLMVLNVKLFVFILLPLFNWFPAIFGGKEVGVG